MYLCTHISLNLGQHNRNYVLNVAVNEPVKNWNNLRVGKDINLLQKCQEESDVRKVEVAQGNASMVILDMCNDCGSVLPTGTCTFIQC